MEGIPIVCEFPDVFPKEMLELPPVRERFHDLADARDNFDIENAVQNGFDRTHRGKSLVIGAFRQRFCQADCHRGEYSYFL